MFSGERHNIGVVLAADLTVIIFASNVQEVFIKQ